MRMKAAWHKFRLNYYRLLVKDCLDDSLKRKLIRKMKYHDDKLKAVTIH